MQSLLGSALAVAVLVAIESLLSAKVADGMSDSTPTQPGRELFGQGLANIAVGLFRGDARDRGNRTHGRERREHVSSRLIQLRRASQADPPLLRSARSQLPACAIDFTAASVPNRYRHTVTLQRGHEVCLRLGP